MAATSLRIFSIGGVGEPIWEGASLIDQGSFIKNDGDVDYCM